MSHATSRSIGENAAESRASRPLQVAEAIKEFVVSNALQPGDKLPNEAELMTLFGMAKGTIREAMRIPCLLYTSPSPRDVEESRMPSSA